MQLNGLVRFGGPPRGREALSVVIKGETPNESKFVERGIKNRCKHRRGLPTFQAAREISGVSDEELLCFWCGRSLISR